MAPTTTVAPAATPAAPAPLGIAVPDDLAYILLTIRTLESGGRYGIGPNKGNASGAYQYIASTWNNYAGYPHAYLAPPDVQDQRALGDVESILRTWNGDVSMIPVIWYYPKAARNPEIMDQVPLPQFGNRLTVREYQRRWLQILSFITGDPAAYALSIAPPGIEFLSGLPPAFEPSPADLSQLAFPVLGSAVVAPPQPCADDACEEGTAAIIYGQTLQPVLAAVDGVVTAVEPGDPVSGAVTLTITDERGRTYHYAGFNDDIPGDENGQGAAPESMRFTVLGQVGTPVKAGQILGYMGDTDPMPSDENRGAPVEAVWPHIRLTIRDRDGVRLDADALVVAAQTTQSCHVGIGPWSTPPDPRLTARGDNPLRRDPVVVDAILNGGWTLHADGTVTAFGKSALIAPPQGCEWAPEDSFGPGASGNQPELVWWVPVEIPARYWVSGSTGGLRPVGLLPRG